jgi:hypothetical protein
VTGGDDGDRHRVPPRGAPTVTVAVAPSAARSRAGRYGMGSIVVTFSELRRMIPGQKRCDPGEPISVAAT